MFNEREMSKAITGLFELYEPSDYQGFDEDERKNLKDEATIYEL